MSEIAFNVNGEPFEMPPGMAAWRVRKLKPKGAPEVVYGRDGLPLFLPMDADIEDLRREARGEGRYRLDPVDDHNRALPNTQASYVCVHPIERELEPVAATASAAAIHADTTTQLVSALLESQKQHTELARMYVSQFPVLVNALSGVVRSAGDAGLPARVPLVVPVAPEAKPVEQAGGAKDSDQDEDDDDDDEEEEADDEDDEDDEEEAEVIEAPSGSGWNWPRVAGSALEKFGPQLESLVGGIPALAATLGGAMRIKKPPAKATEPASGAPAADIGAHLMAIRAALTPDEGARVMALANELSMADKLTYFEKLRGMSVPEAVAYVRAELAGLARNSARGEAGPEAGSEPGMAMSEDEFDAHFDAICAAMAPEEGKTVRLMFEELVFEHRFIWAEKLSRMSVPQGVAFFRRQLAAAGWNTREQSEIEARIVRTANATRVPGTAPSAASAPRMAPGATAGSAPRTAPGATAGPRRDGGRVARSPSPSNSPSATPTAATAGAPIAGLSTVSPGTQGQIAAIQRELTPDEDMAMRRYVAGLPSADRSAWIATLLVLPVPEAVAMIRAQLAGDRAHAGQRDATAISGGPHAPATTAEPAPRNLATPAPRLPMFASGEISVSHNKPRVREGEAAHARATSSSAGGGVLHEELPTRGALPVPASAAAAIPETRVPREELPARSALPVPASAAAAIPETRVPREERSTPGTTAGPEPAAPVSRDATPSISRASVAQRPVDMDADGHLLAIEHALTDGERFLVHAMIAQVPPEERRKWQDQLLSVPVAEAAAILRVAIQELTAGTLPVDAHVGGTPDPLDLASAHVRAVNDGQQLDSDQPGDREALDDNLEHDHEQPSDDDGRLDDEQELDDDQELDDQELDDQELDEGQEFDSEPPFDGEELDDGRELGRAVEGGPEFDDEQPDVVWGLDHRAVGNDSANGARAALTAPVSSATVPTVGLPTLSPDAFSHFKAIEAALTFTERMRVYELGAQLSPAEVTAWIAELAPLPLSEAVAKVRAALAAVDGASHKARKGGVS